MPEEMVKLEMEPRVAAITLNRPEKGNALDSAGLTALAGKLASVSSQSDIQVLILQGKGRDFCLGREPGPKRPGTLAEWTEVLDQITRANDALRAFPGIGICLVRGKAYGFGCGLAVQSDITLAAETARFCFPEIKAALPPTIVMSYLSRWMERKKAFELVITGKEIDAREAERLGIVNLVVVENNLTAEGKRWASLLLSEDPEALRICKSFFQETAEWKSEDAARRGKTLLAKVMSGRAMRKVKEE